VEFNTDEYMPLLTAARELLTDSGRWTQFAVARDPNGQIAKPREPAATCWCFIGALAHLSPGGVIPYNLLKFVDEKIVEFMPNFVKASVVGFEWIHDRMFDHEKMLEFLDFVILKLREGAPGTPSPFTASGSTPSR
jgi:hypothetical protein